MKEFKKTINKKAINKLSLKQLRVLWKILKKVK